MRTSILILFLLNYSAIFTQSEIEFLQSSNAAKELSPFSMADHSSIQPMVLVLPALKKDTLPKCAFKKPMYENASNYLWLEALGQSGAKSKQLVLGTGIWTNWRISNKWSANFGIRYLYQSSSFNDSTSNFVSQIVSKSIVRGNIKSGLDIRGRLRYQAHKNIQFIAGVDKNFIGEGNRSLLLSDIGNPYPFAQLQFTFWKFKYLYMQQFLKENGQYNKRLSNKYNASHYLDCNLGHGFTFGLFESVIFQPKDTLYNRGYDLDYLNPVVFFKPQEYNNGSVDNIILGFNFSYQYKNVKAYAQIVIDEFVLNEIKAKKGWWGNKYGIQAGIKGRHKINNLNIFWRTEYNLIQKFTYTHLNNLQNYGNLNVSLAHPLQAGFREILSELSLESQKIKGLRIDFFFAFTTQIKNTSSFNNGENVYQSYVTRDSDYGFYVPKFGNKTSPFGNLKICYSRPRNFYEVFVQSGRNSLNQNFVAFGLRSKIGNLHLSW